MNCAGVPFALTFAGYTITRCKASDTYTLFCASTATATGDRSPFSTRFVLLESRFDCWAVLLLKLFWPSTSDALGPKQFALQGAGGRSEALNRSTRLFPTSVTYRLPFLSKTM